MHFKLEFTNQYKVFLSCNFLKSLHIYYMFSKRWSQQASLKASQVSRKLMWTIFWILEVTGKRGLGI